MCSLFVEAAFVTLDTYHMSSDREILEKPQEVGG
jgi:hypothetical protein